MLKQWLIEYSHDVLNGDIVACEKHKWACLRFLNDIEKEGQRISPMCLTRKRALHFLNWMALFKHTKGKLAGERIEPQPIQIFVFGNIYGWVHKDTKLRRFKKAYWQVGRKNAKSQSLACVGSSMKIAD
jgi:phage terminase large subunit-like protein